MRSDFSSSNKLLTSLSRVMHCTHVVCVSCVDTSPCVRSSCATKDANNEDYVCKANIPAGINCLPPSKTISPITWLTGPHAHFSKIYIPNVRVSLVL